MCGILLFIPIIINAHPPTRESGNPELASDLGGFSARSLVGALSSRGHIVQEEATV